MFKSKFPQARRSRSTRTGPRSVRSVGMRPMRWWEAHAGLRVVWWQYLCLRRRRRRQRQQSLMQCQCTQFRRVRRQKMKYFTVTGDCLRTFCVKARSHWAVLIPPRVILRNSTARTRGSLRAFNMRMLLVIMPLSCLWSTLLTFFKTAQGCRECKGNWHLKPGLEVLTPCFAVASRLWFDYWTCSWMILWASLRRKPWKLLQSPKGMSQLVHGQSNNEWSTSFASKSCQFISMVKPEKLCQAMKT